MTRNTFEKFGNSRINKSLPAASQIKRHRTGEDNRMRLGDEKQLSGIIPNFLFIPLH